MCILDSYIYPLLLDVGYMMSMCNGKHGTQMKVRCRERYEMQRMIGDNRRYLERTRQREWDEPERA